MKQSVTVAIAFAALAYGATLEAQGRSQSAEKDIPPGERPPAGMCRIWLDDVPAAQQPAPTDCASAVRNRPAKGRVIFGDDYVNSKRPDTTTRTKTPPAAKGFAPGSSSKKPPIRLRRP